MPQSRLPGVLWGILVLGILWVTGGFLRSLSSPPLPVIGQVRPFTLTNQLGRPVGLDSLAGHVWVADVVFSRCPTQCRKLSRQMQRIQGALPAGVRLVTLTADPEFDLPDVLARYGKQYEADPGRWWFLTGQRTDVYRLAIEDLKFNVLETGKPGDNFEDLFIHSANFAIVDKQGRVRAVVQGDADGAEEDVLRIVRLLGRQQ